jgi:hypothetical protein
MNDVSCADEKPAEDTLRVALADFSAGGVAGGRTWPQCTLRALKTSSLTPSLQSAAFAKTVTAPIDRVMVMRQVCTHVLKTWIHSDYFAVRSTMVMGRFACPIGTW